MGWLWPAFAPAVTASTSSVGAASKSAGHGFPRLTALCSGGQGGHHGNGGCPLGQGCWESGELRAWSGAGVRQKWRWSWWGGSEFVVVHMAGHGPGDQFTAQAVAEQFGKL